MNPSALPVVSSRKEAPKGQDLIEATVRESNTYARKEAGGKKVYYHAGSIVKVTARELELGRTCLMSPAEVAEKATAKVEESSEVEAMRAQRRRAKEAQQQAFKASKEAYALRQRRDAQVAEQVAKSLLGET